ncbi:iron-sulfur cluster co-chaperone protein HscB, mitochondrial-like [Lingula anatina]|uniref:Iron-sulfur cluster co-chaperone protein HscB, mitochondrial-like n=1 Tax=Lingula anatina TaxID=7574 RepID=A0A1S3JYJ6_LINAN|nr:iron-sulfur cluster co-chaperone protein HscB, mitochondrial-like [Lingula anatina]|eukprot:XP_013415463.1 iron-sulfur cluster co-chaperone protein HscB, mitochondrial-like [Lingula anatina]
MATTILCRCGRTVAQQSCKYSRFLVSAKSEKYSHAAPSVNCAHLNLQFPFGSIVTNASAVRGFSRSRWLQHNSCNQDEDRQQKEKLDNLERPCWRCHKIVNPKEDLFFCTYEDCGVIQHPLEQLTFFQIMGIAKSFDIDTVRMSKIYRNLQRLIHPDKFSQKSVEERTISEQQASLINKAYFTLLHPLSRGLYILELEGISIEEDSIDMEPEFLMEVMEINERILESDDAKEVEQIKQENKNNKDNLVKELSFAFRQNDFAQAKILLSRMKYFANIEDKVKEFERARAGVDL